ncbi:hypothetical protein [Oscillibacter ruminantium]|uniref:hypothetical protein n=1 Tax=Oscillibacter ruminantium TaxID=1263547 RepID=UPI000590D1E6|nr:hypothetical protein [Oscillibacter ruminantium]
MTVDENRVGDAAEMASARLMLDQYGCEICSNYYISNCLIEAIKAKLRNSNVHIIMRKVHGGLIPHFLWRDESGLIYDFGTDHSILTPLMYRGYLRRRREHD